MLHPERFVFSDDGRFPNSRLPVLLYRQAVDPRRFDFEVELHARDWSNSWRNGVYAYHHYHSTTHEVLAVSKGSATLRLGGPEHGADLEVEAGDVIVIPAGVAHQRVKAGPGFEVVGAYPGGRQWDLLRGEPGERPDADRNLARVPLPEQDPLYGADGPLLELWR